MRENILGRDLKRDTKVYRIIPRKYFDDMFTNKHNALVRPKLWMDPYENLALNSKVVDQSGKLWKFTDADDIYAQCWTLNQASDAMWQIYSQGPNRTNGIRIRSTIGKLLDSLLACNDSYIANDLCCFIGKVKYLKDTKLKNFADHHFKGSGFISGKQIAETLLVKRTAFKHENEVRLIYYSRESTAPQDDLFRYNFDPHNLIDQIMLHPSLGKPKARKLKDEIKLLYNWQGEIKRSKLYDRPKGYIFTVRQQ